MANILVQTFGGVVKNIEASTPAEAAEKLGQSLENTTINVNSEKADPNHTLRDTDFVSFVTDKVTSGSSK